MLQFDNIDDIKQLAKGNQPSNGIDAPTLPHAMSKRAPAGGEFTLGKGCRIVRDQKSLDKWLRLVGWEAVWAALRTKATSLD